MPQGEERNALNARSNTIVSKLWKKRKKSVKALGIMNKNKTKRNVGRPKGMTPRRIAEVSIAIAEGATSIQEQIDRIKMERDTAIAKCVQFGNSVEDMASLLEMSTPVIRNACKINGVELKDRRTEGRTPRNAYVILNMLLKGFSDLEVAIALGLSRQRVYSCRAAAISAGILHGELAKTMPDESVLTKLGMND
jgi:hypothetical protein